MTRRVHGDHDGVHDVARSFAGLAARFPEGTESSTLDAYVAALARRYGVERLTAEWQRLHGFPRSPQMRRQVELLERAIDAALYLEHAAEEP
jgi:hypothetical protein